MGKSTRAKIHFPITDTMHHRFALAGALGCAVTHGALTPVDVVKTRIQLSPEIYNKVNF